MDRATLRQSFTRLASHYGMAGVLLLLCVYYSWATYTEQQPRGAAAVTVLMKQITKADEKTAVLIVARNTEEDTVFVNALEAQLKFPRCFPKKKWSPFSGHSI